MALAALLLPLAGPVLAAQVEGRILGPAGVTPIPGAIVTFHHLGSGFSQVSEPSAIDGSYLVPRMPAGRYDIAVRTERGLWLANQPLLFGPDEVKKMVFEGRRATWPKIERIRNTTQISRSFDDCLKQMSERYRYVKR